MYVIIPHVGKSHLTLRLLNSIPDDHKIILIDGSYVRDLETYAKNQASRIDYVHTPEPYCLAKNWNLAAARVPAKEAEWMFVASDIEFSPLSWRRITAALDLYPDCGIIKDGPTNWNVWIVRRWAWDLLAPMDERYKPCGGEDDDLVMKCQASGIKIRPHPMCVQHSEGGHATRIDIGNGQGANNRLFQRKWGCRPSKSRDEKYAQAISDTHVLKRRREPPAAIAIPTERGNYPEATPFEWKEPIHLNLGAGIKPMEGFVNIDLPGKRCDYALDVVAEEWPWAPESVSRIESYHFLEHLTEEDGRRVMQRAFRALKPGGVFVAETPDLLALCSHYERSRRKGRWGIYGKPGWGNGMAHRWGYCAETFRLVLGNIGFKEIRTGKGTDYHQTKGICPSVRVEAVK